MRKFQLSSIFQNLKRTRLSFGMCRRHQDTLCQYFSSSLTLEVLGMDTCFFHLETMRSISTTALILATRGIRSPKREYFKKSTKASPRGVRLSRLSSQVSQQRLLSPSDFRQ